MAGTCRNTREKAVISNRTRMDPLIVLKSDFSNEQLFIILSCRLMLGTATPAEVEQLFRSASVDFEKVYHLACIHHVRPLLLTAIDEYQLKVPADFYQQLNTFARQHQLRVLEHVHICARAQQMLANAGIASFTYKGVAFAATCYPDIALRESTDIDFLVKPQDAQAIKQLFESAGYQPKVSVPDRYMQYYTKEFKELVYTAATRDGRGCSVEIHWKLIDTYFGEFPGFEFFEKDMVDMPCSGTTITTLKPGAHLLAVISNHFVKDMGVKFKYLLDVAMLLNHCPALDAKEVLKVTDAYRCRRKTEAGLFLTEKILGVGLAGMKYKYHHKILPGAVLPERFPFSETLVRNRPFMQAALRVQDDFMGRMKFVLRSMKYQLLPTERDLNAVRSMPVPLWLLVLMRPFRQAKQLLTKARWGRN